jgi:hypothetical protein
MLALLQQHTLALAPEGQDDGFYEKRFDNNLSRFAG